MIANCPRCSQPLGDDAFVVIESNGWHVHKRCSLESETKRPGCSCHTDGAGHWCQFCQDVDAKKVLVQAVKEVMGETVARHDCCPEQYCECTCGGCKCHERRIEECEMRNRVDSDQVISLMREAEDGQ